MGSTLPEATWVEPIPDGSVLPTGADPADVAVARDSVRLAFVATLQHLPPRQRAVLILREVLSWRASEVAELLDTTVASVNSALQRARATLATARPRAEREAALDDQQQALLERYVDAFERYDMDALTALLHEDATQSMPPFAMWLRGREDILRWWLGQGAGCRGSRLVPTAANGSPAFAQYKPSGPGGAHRAVGAAGPADLRRTASSSSRSSCPPTRCSPCSGCRSSPRPALPRLGTGRAGRRPGASRRSAVAGGASRAGRPVTARALDLLGAFDTAHRRMTLTELAARAGLPIATAHRLVAELVGWGALARRHDGAYEVGHRLWTLGLLAPVQGELREVAAPFLQDLYAATGDTVHLAVREGNRALYVERLSGNASVPVVSQVGGRLPLHTTGVGKVLLAHAPPDVVRQVLGS